MAIECTAKPQKNGAVSLCSAGHDQAVLFDVSEHFGTRIQPIDATHAFLFGFFRRECLRNYREIFVVQYLVIHRFPDRDIIQAFKFIKR